MKTWDREEGIHAEISGEKKWNLNKNSDLVVEASGMYNKLKNKISLQTISTGSPITLQYFNIENFSNFVSSMRLKYATRDLQGTLGYSHTVVIESTGLPSNTFSELLASASYLIPKINTRFNWFYRYSSNQPIYFADGSFSYE